ncbi:hypothetical protein AB0B50_40825 [Streptomyces sp. NPDC041068]|uniref:hypothetical protein n=1 Tax=Streptomyces sp. NPDC041068 TaxID=3155130 RepID=UPI00340EC408
MAAVPCGVVHCRPYAPRFAAAGLVPLLGWYGQRQAVPQSYTSPQGTCDSPVTCNLGTLAASASATVTLALAPTTTGTVTVTGVTQTNEPGPDTSNNFASETTTFNNANGCTITGTNGDNFIVGTNADDVTCALGGDDNVEGGNDAIYGVDGRDSLFGQNDDDTTDAARRKQADPRPPESRGRRGPLRPRKNRGLDALQSAPLGLDGLGRTGRGHAGVSPAGARSLQGRRIQGFRGRTPSSRPLRRSG